MIQFRVLVRVLAAIVAAACGAAAAVTTPDSASSSAARPPEAPIDLGRLSRAERIEILRARASADYRSGKYATAITWAQGYLKEGGTDPKLSALLSRATYFVGDHENAARGLHAEVELAEKANQPPAEDALKLLAQCYSRLNDITAEVWALEKLVTYYPTTRHWADLIARTQQRANFNDALALDVWRLKLVTGTMDGAADYLAAASLSLQAGFIAEARTILDKGFRSGPPGTTADAERLRRLRSTLAERLADDPRRDGRSDLPTTASQPGGGSALIDTGLARVFYGDRAGGIALMERGLRMAGSNRPQYDKLHLGIAYLIAGRNADAVAMLNTVTGRHGAGDLGHLWYLYALRASMDH